jgi:Kef-type K+ transport system membrane component KefB
MLAVFIKKHHSHAALDRGPVQAILTVAAASLISMKPGLSWSESIFIGLFMSFSSAAVVLNLFQKSAMVHPTNFEDVFQY